MSKWKPYLIVSVLLLVAGITAGCAFGSQDTESEIDPPQIDYTEGEEGAGEIMFELDESDQPAEENIEEESTDEEGTGDRPEDGADPAEEGEQGTKEVKRTLYMFDHQGYVTPIEVTVPHTESVAKQSLEYLVIDGPVTPLLPDGMRAVLPPGTEMTVNINGNTAVVDFSSEFEEYQAEDEKGILEAITWTLTEFEPIEQVKISINGYETDVMPVDGTPIGQSLSRKDGINIEVATGTSIGQNSVVTLFFQAQSPSGDHQYYVPISRIVERSEDLVAATVEETMAGPEIGSGLFSNLGLSTQLLDAKVEGNTAILDFDEQFIGTSDDEATASYETFHSLVLALTQTGVVDQVQFMVNGNENALTVEGIDLSQPVSRPTSINGTGF